MKTLTPKQRLHNTFKGEPVDRVPVIIPGGMMAGTLFALVTETGLPYPGIHTDLQHMVRYTRYLQERCGIDNTGVPFCMTVEAEDYGAEVDLGDVWHEPRIAKSPFRTLNELLNYQPQVSPRHKVTLAAIEQLAGGDVPVIGNIIGPMSLLTSLVDQGVVYRALERDKQLLAEVLQTLGRHLICFAEEQIRAGADYLVMADPSAAGDILGPEYFADFMVPAYQSILEALRCSKRPIILHICGRTLNLVHQLEQLHWDGLSVDSLVNLKRLRQNLGPRVLMGNVSTYVMANSDHAGTYRHSKKAVETTAILAPACGLSTGTPLKNIQALVKAAEDAARELEAND